MISVKSRKAKGRRLQNWVRDTLLSLFPKLTDEDIYCAIMGERGVDIKLSKRAREVIPYAIECKNKQALKSIYTIMGQAQYNAKETQVPLAVIKMNQFHPLVIVDAIHFFKMIGK